MYCETKQQKQKKRSKFKETCVRTLAETVGCADGLALLRGVGFGDVVGWLLCDGDDDGSEEIVGLLEMVGAAVPCILVDTYDPQEEKL